MLRLKKPLFFLFFYSLLFGIVYAAVDLNYPYGKFNLSTPPEYDPFPGLGSYYSTLSKGMQSALWNPASLGKLEKSEGAISFLNTPAGIAVPQSTTVAEQSGSIPGYNNTAALGSYGVFLRAPQDIGSGINTTEVNVHANSDYRAQSSGIAFSSAMKVNDWLAVGFMSQNPLNGEIDMAGSFPTTTKASVDLRGKQLSNEIRFDSIGKLNYTYSSGGTVTTFETTQALWSGFLSQEASLPFTSISEIQNNINFESPYVGTLASTFGKFCMGLNLIPISASANFNNNQNTYVNANISDIFVYTPNFDPNNETAIADWVNDPSQYGTSAGYTRKQIVVPAGEIVANGRYRASYNASTARFDLGAMYDLSEWVTLGAVLENSGGATLDFKGSGLAYYVDYRNINTAEASLDKLLEPGSESSYAPITGTWTSTNEINGYKLYLEPDKSYALPKRLRFGISFRKPFLIALDYEQNQTPIKFTTTSSNGQAQEIVISNINLLRMGMESQFFRLPAWWRLGLTFMAKPNITGLDSSQQETVDKYFKYGLLPIRIDFGSNFKAWDTSAGFSLGVNGQSILNLLQLDSNNADLTKTVYYNLYVERGFWQFSYLVQVDPTASAAAYSAKTVPEGQARSFATSDLRFTQTMGVTYHF